MSSEKTVKVSGILGDIASEITMPAGMDHVLLLHRQVERSIEQVKDECKNEGRKLTTAMRAPLDRSLSEFATELDAYDEELFITCTITPDVGKPVNVKACGLTAYGVATALNEGDEVQASGVLQGETLIAESVGRVLVQSGAQVLARELSRVSTSPEQPSAPAPAEAEVEDTAPTTGENDADESPEAEAAEQSDTDGGEEESS